MILAAGSCAAQAKDAECLWNKLPPSRRADVLGPGLDGAAASIKRLTGSEEFLNAASACDLGSSGLSDVQTATTGVVYQKIAEAWLGANAKLTPQQLDAGWRAVDPALRAKVLAAVQSDTADDALKDQVRAAFIGALGLPPQANADVLLQLTAYMAGRTIREGVEPKL
jgi:hypothetical protein